MLTRPLHPHVSSTLRATKEGTIPAGVTDDADDGGSTSWASSRPSRYGPPELHPRQRQMLRPQQATVIRTISRVDPLVRSSLAVRKSLINCFTNGRPFHVSVLSCTVMYPQVPKKSPWIVEDSIRWRRVQGIKICTRDHAIRGAPCGLRPMRVVCRLDRRSPPATLFPS